MKTFQLTLKGLDGLKVALAVGAKAGKNVVVPGYLFRDKHTKKPDWVMACDDSDFGDLFVDVLAEMVVAKLREMKGFPTEPIQEPFQLRCEEFNDKVFRRVAKHFPGCEGAWVNEGEESQLEVAPVETPVEASESEASESEASKEPEVPEPEVPEPEVPEPEVPEPEVPEPEASESEASEPSPVKRRRKQEWRG